MPKIIAVRGAVTVKENNADEIKETTKTLMSEIFSQNNLSDSDLINIIFTITDDIDAMNPATAARQEFKLDLTPLLCVKEMNVQGALPKCIRVLVQAYSELKKENIKHIYLGGAAGLRPDLGTKSYR